jgi:hypothetical protein
MRELVHEHVLREAGVDRRGRLPVVNPSAAVLLLIHEDLDELVWRG